MPSRKVLVLMKGYLGDAVMATPLLKGLSEQAGEVHVLTSAPVVELLAGTFPDLRYHSMRRLEKPLDLLRQARELQALKVDLALIVNRSFRSALAARLAKIRHRIGHDAETRSWLLTKAVKYDQKKNEALCYLDLASAAGYAIEATPPHLNVDGRMRASGLEKLQGATIGFQPGARYERKQIPLKTMATVAAALQEEGHKIAIFGGPEEKAHARALQKLLKEPALDLVGAISLVETPGVMSNLRAMVGGDTGLMHIAAASECPTVTCFGPTKWWKWGHFEPPHEVLSHRSRDISKISADEILQAVHRVLESA